VPLPCLGPVRRRHTTVPWPRAAFSPLDTAVARHVVAPRLYAAGQLQHLQLPCMQWLGVEASDCIWELGREVGAERAEASGSRGGEGTRWKRCLVDIYTYASGSSACKDGRKVWLGFDSVVLSILVNRRQELN